LVKDDLAFLQLFYKKNFLCVKASPSTALPLSKTQHKMLKKLPKYVVFKIERLKAKDK
jgi:hypothetical protein